MFTHSLAVQGIDQRSPSSWPGDIFQPMFEYFSKAGGVISMFLDAVQSANWHA